MGLVEDILYKETGLRVDNFLGLAETDPIFQYNAKGLEKILINMVRNKEISNKTYSDYNRVMEFKIRRINDKHLVKVFANCNNNLMRGMEQNDVMRENLEDVIFARECSRDFTVIYDYLLEAGVLDGGDKTAEVVFDLLTEVKELFDNNNTTAWLGFSELARVVRGCVLHDYVNRFKFIPMLDFIKSKLKYKLEIAKTSITIKFSEESYWRRIGKEERQYDQEVLERYSPSRIEIDMVNNTYLEIKNPLIYRTIASREKKRLDELLYNEEIPNFVYDEAQRTFIINPIIETKRYYLPILEYAETELIYPNPLCVLQYSKADLGKARYLAEILVKGLTNEVIENEYLTMFKSWNHIMLKDKYLTKDQYNQFYEESLHEVLQALIKHHVIDKERYNEILKEAGI